LEAHVKTADREILPAIRQPPGETAMRKSAYRKPRFVVPMAAQQGVHANRSRTWPWMALLVFHLFFMIGCDSVETYKNTLRAASRTMVRIADMSLREEGGLNVVYLETVEERVSDACQSLLDSVDYRFRGEDIPMNTKIGVVFTADNCQRVVEQAQPEIERLQGGVSNDPVDAN
jgi:hypothetical protein